MDELERGRQERETTRSRPAQLHTHEKWETDECHGRLK
jgi:hypothetical protein